MAVTMAGNAWVALCSLSVLVLVLLTTTVRDERHMRQG